MHLRLAADPALQRHDAPDDEAEPEDAARDPERVERREATDPVHRAAAAAASCRGRQGGGVSQAGEMGSQAGGKGKTNVGQRGFRQVSQAEGSQGGSEIGSQAGGQRGKSGERGGNAGERERGVGLGQGETKSPWVRTSPSPAAFCRYKTRWQGWNPRDLHACHGDALWACVGFWVKWLDPGKVPPLTDCLNAS